MRIHANMLDQPVHAAHSSSGPPSPLSTCTQRAERPSVSGSGTVAEDGDRLSIRPLQLKQVSAAPLQDQALERIGVFSNHNVNSFRAKFLEQQGLSKWTPQAEHSMQKKLEEEIEGLMRSSTQLSQGSTLVETPSVPAKSKLRQALYSNNPTYFEAPRAVPSVPKGTRSSNNGVSRFIDKMSHALSKHGKPPQPARATGNAQGLAPIRDRVISAPLLQSSTQDDALFNKPLPGTSSRWSIDEASLMDIQATNKRSFGKLLGRLGPELKATLSKPFKSSKPSQ